MPTTTIGIDPRQYADRDGPLTAAADDFLRSHGIEGQDLHPRWQDETARNVILLDVPTECIEREIAYLERLHMTAQEWNERHGVGTRVRYDSIIPPIANARGFYSRTRSEAWTLGSGHAVVKIEGRTGGFHLSHLTPLPDPATPTTEDP